MLEAQHGTEPAASLPWTPDYAATSRDEQYDAQPLTMNVSGGDFSIGSRDGLIESGEHKIFRRPIEAACH